MNPCIMFGFMRSPLEIIAVKLSSLAIDRSILAITGILMMGLGWILPAEARPPTSVKSAIVRAEAPDRKKQYVALPYAFSAESLGFTVGVGAAVKGYGQDQLLFGGTVFGSTDEAVALFLGMWDYRLPVRIQRIVDTRCIQRIVDISASPTFLVMAKTSCNNI